MQEPPWMISHWQNKLGSPNWEHDGQPLQPVHIVARAVCMAHSSLMYRYKSMKIQPGTVSHDKSKQSVGVPKGKSTNCKGSPIMPNEYLIVN